MASIEQYETVVNAVQALAGVCDYASSRDNMGYNGGDAEYGHSIANQTIGGRVLSEAQQRAAIKMIQKYRKQLATYGIEIPTIKEYGDAYAGLGSVAVAAGQSKFNVNGGDNPAVKEAEAVIKLEDVGITVRFNRTSNKVRFEELKDRVKTLPHAGRRFDFEGMRWIVDRKYARELCERFAAEGFIDPAVRELAFAENQVDLQAEPGLVTQATLRIVKDRIVFRTPRYDAAWHAFAKSVPGGRWNPEEKFWHFPTSSAYWITQQDVISTIDVDPAVTAIADEFAQRDELSRKHDGELIDELPIPAGLVPFPYQQAGYNFLKSAEFRAILADDMGLGKTIQAILVMMKVRDEGPILVSCPATVKLNWKREIEKWIPGIRVQVLNGRTPETAINPGEFDVFVINHDILAYGDGAAKDGVSGWFEQFEAVNLSLAVFDEGHKIGNHKTIRGKAARRIAKATKRTMILTGTPVQNRPRELFPLLNMVDPGSWPNFFQFAKRYCNAHQTRFGWDFSGSSNLPELHERIKPWVLRRTKDQVLKELPGKRRVDIVLELSKKDRREYDNRVEYWANRIRTRSMENGDHLVMIGELRQLAAKAKLQGSINWIGDFVETGEKLIVFAVHKATIKAIQESLEKLDVRYVTITGETSQTKRQEAVDAFQNDPGVQVFIGNIQAAGEGITLTAASNEVFVEFGWKPGEHAQAEDRANRIGQDSLVTCWYMVAEKTIDERLFGIIDGKRRVVETIMEGSSRAHESDVVRLNTETGELTEVDGDLVEALAAKTFA